MQFGKFSKKKKIIRKFERGTCCKTKKENELI